MQVEETNESESSTVEREEGVGRDAHVSLRDYKRLRDESLNHRLKRLEAQEELTTLKNNFQRDLDAGMASVREEERSAARRTVALAKLEALATREGLQDPDLLSLLDTSGVELDDRGRVKDAEQLIAEFRSAKPQFFGSPATSSSAPRPKADDNTSKVDASEMSDREYAALRKKMGIR